MQQMANAIMAGEQLMTGLPAAAAAPRGAPPPEGSGFSLMLGEHLWTLSQLNGTGGDSQATGMPVLAMGDGDAAATLDPDAIMQGLLAEIVNLAVDSSGGLEQLSGRLAAKLQQAIDRLAGEQDGSGDAGAEQAAVASELENAAGMPVPDADRLHVTGGAETADAGVVNVTDDAEPAAAAESAALAGKQGITPAMLAPVVRQVLEQLFDELGNGMQAGLLESVISAGSPGPANTAAVASGSTDNTAAATVQRPLIQQPVVQPSLQTDAVPVVNTAQAMLNEQAVSRGVESNTPLLSQAEPALKPSASAQWFNLAAGTAEQTGPRPDSLASLQPVAAVPVPQMAGKLSASPVEPVTEQITELAVHGQDDLRLQVTAQRGSALDPATRLDVVVSDPEGELEEMAVSMRITANAPERMLSSHEMQRVSEAMRRVISGESAMQDSAEASVEQPLAASVQRSSVVTEETDGPAQGEPGEAAEAVDTELPTRRVSPARETEQGEAAASTNEAEESAPVSQRRMDSLLSMALGRSRPVVDNAAVTARDGGLQGPEGTDAVLRGESIQQTVLQHPVMPEHPGNQAALPDRLLQFSNPAPAADVSGYALDELPQQLIDRLNTLRNAGNGLYNVKMDLYPKELGRLVVNMAVRGDNVILQVAAINQGQRDELRRSLVSLKQALEEEGMSVVDMRVIGLAEDGAGRDTQRQTAR